MFLLDVRIVFLGLRLSWVVSSQISWGICQWGKETEESKPGSWTVSQGHLAWFLSVSGSSVAWLPSCFRCSSHLGRAHPFRICSLACFALGGAGRGSWPSCLPISLNCLASLPGVGWWSHVCRLPPAGGPHTAYPPDTGGLPLSHSWLLHSRVPAGQLHFQIRVYVRSSGHFLLLR